MKVEYPSEKEIKTSIDATLDKAWPARQPILGTLAEMCRQIGTANILYGMKKYGLIMALLYTAIIWLRCEAEYRMGDDTEMIIIFLMPLIFIGVLGLGVISDMEQNVYELTMTCRYTPYHLLALRMIAVSVFIICLNGGFCIIAMVLSQLKYLIHGAFLSVTVTLIYGLLYLKVLTGSVHPARQVLLYGTWLAANALFKGAVPELYNFIVLELPAVCHIAVWIFMVPLIGKQMGRYLDYSCRCSIYWGGLKC